MAYQTKFKHLREKERLEIREFIKGKSREEVIRTMQERNWRRELVAEELGVGVRTIYNIINYEAEARVVKPRNKKVYA